MSSLRQIHKDLAEARDVGIGSLHFLWQVVTLQQLVHGISIAHECEIFPALDKHLGVLTY